MLIFKRVYSTGKAFESWLILTALPALLPFIVSAITATNRKALHGETEDYFKATDLIFIGISMCISNLNVWTTRLPSRSKKRLIALSVIFLFVLTICLTLAHSETGISTLVSRIAGSIVVLSIITSLRISITVSELSKHKSGTT